MGHLAQSWREKKTSMCFGSLLLSFESIMDLTKKLSCLMSLTTLLILNDSFGVENYN